MGKRKKENGVGEHFLKSGKRQGCLLSTLLAHIVIKVLAMARERQEGRIKKGRIQIILICDDIETMGF